MNYIHPTALIGPNVEIGDGNYIGPFCIIGYPAEHKEFWPGMVQPVFLESLGIVIGKITEPFPFVSSGSVRIGNNNVITGHVTIDAGTEGITEIGDGNWFLKHSHLGHDAKIINGNTISCGVKIGGHCLIGSNVNLGLNSVIHQRKLVPDGVMIGMGAVVTKKTELNEGMKYAGNPARLLGPNVKVEYQDKTLTEEEKSDIKKKIEKRFKDTDFTQLVFKR